MNFPVEWAALRFPEKRSELIQYLEDISSSNGLEKGANLDIDFVYNFFFDDTDLGAGAAMEINYILLNDQEAVLIDDLTLRLSSMLDELGDEKLPAFLENPKWVEIQMASKRALEEISKYGLPSFS